MILEAIVTTLDEDGTMHLSPMGPTVDEGFQRFTLRPFQTSHTFRNLQRSRQGVLHVTDDVELVARTAIGQPDVPPASKPAPLIEGRILIDACRWYAFEVQDIDDREPRAVISCGVVAAGRQRDFFGFNRAKHAVIEAAILATRLTITPREIVDTEFTRLAPLVEKTGGPAERRAFAYLTQQVTEFYGPPQDSGGR